MKFRLSPVLIAVFTLALASLACQALAADMPADSAPPVATSADTSEESSTDSPRAPLDADAPAMPEPVQSQGAGMACFGLRAGGLTCLDENGWQTFTTANSGLPTDFLSAGGLCPDGRIVIAHYEGLSLFDGVNWENIPKTSNYSSADAVACAADGSLWVAHFQGVSRYANGEWTTYASALLATGESANELVYDVAVSSDGRVWVVTSRSVAVFENDEWDIFQEGQGFTESVFFNELTLDSLDRPWAGLSSGAAVYDGNWKMVNKPGYSNPSSMVFDAAGNLWIGTITGGVSMYNGNAWVDFNRKLESLPSDNIRDLAADSQGRVWVATTYGLVIIDGDNRQTYRMENSAVGDNEIEFVVVVKDGPTLPATTVQQPGSMTGKLEKADGAPLSGMRVEICVESLGSQFSGETPCSDQPFFLSTETDASGVFAFENIPVGYYVLVAETGDGWAQLTTEFGIGSERTPILAGESYDIGTLTLEE